MKRRQFLFHAFNASLLYAGAKMTVAHAVRKPRRLSEIVTLFLSGDVMTGRGIDQILPHPNDPVIHEPYVRDARHYVELAERRNGAITKPVDFAYIWGDALGELNRVRPDVRIINLETSVTASDDFWPGKGIHYRMHPRNVPCLTAAAIDCCALANNHVLDWGYEGLAETLQTLDNANLRTAGAGRNLAEAKAPAMLPVPGRGRVLVFSFGTESSGIHPDMGAREGRPGVHLLPDLSDRTVEHIKLDVQTVKRSNDVVVASIHWGGNWGYEIPGAHVRFAHALIDTADVDIVHGHSAHHVKSIEVYKDKLILYGCGDFLTDYEGIPGYEEYRDDLGLMYFVQVVPRDGKLVSVQMVATQIRRFRVGRAAQRDRIWLRRLLEREGRRFNTRPEINEDVLCLNWW